MSQTLPRAYSATVASGLTFSSAIDLGEAPQWLTLMVPTMASGADIRVFYSDVIDGTYLRGGVMNNTTGNALLYNIPSGITQAALNIPVYGRFIQVQLSTATTDTAYIFKVIVSP